MPARATSLAPSSGEDAADRRPGAEMGDADMVQPPQARGSMRDALGQTARSADANPPSARVPWNTNGDPRLVAGSPFHIVVARMCGVHRLSPSPMWLPSTGVSNEPAAPLRIE